MYYSKLAAPILLVADCTQAPPLDLAEEVLGSEILAYARLHPSQAHALIWSRLIITTILSHYFPDEFEKAVIEDEFENSVCFKGLPFKYAKIGATKGRVAIAMSTLPVFLSFKTYDTTNSMKELVRMRFSVIFNDWIDRQENPELAFYHYGPSPTVSLSEATRRCGRSSVTMTSLAYAAPASCFAKHLNFGALQSGSARFRARR